MLSDSGVTALSFANKVVKVQPQKFVCSIIGCVLSQLDNSQEKVIAYLRWTLTQPEQNYCVTRKELPAVIKSIKHFHKYLYGQKLFTEFRRHRRTSGSLDFTRGHRIVMRMDYHEDPVIWNVNSVNIGKRMMYLFRSKCWHIRQNGDKNKWMMMILVSFYDPNNKMPNLDGHTFQTS